MVPIRKSFSEGQAEDAILLGSMGLGQWRGQGRAAADQAKGEANSPQITQMGAEREGNLGPSLAVKTPLVQDDLLRRDDFASRGSHLARINAKNANEKPLQLKSEDMRQEVRLHPLNPA
jgi:hypothetical protein